MAPGSEFILVQMLVADTEEIMMMGLVSLDRLGGGGGGVSGDS